MTLSPTTEHDTPLFSRWTDVLADRIDPQWAQEIDDYESQLELRQQEKIEEKIFAETRLRRGSYGQRYDAGTRHDGIEERTLDFERKPTKGPDTLWDAPGMQRIKIPYGGVSREQLETLADVAEEYSNGILHITTRQDVQLHFVHIEDTPDLMRRLAAVGITTREACGNSVRNITACPLAGVCKTEAFDVSPYAKAMMTFLLGHPDVQDFGRKYKPAFSGCEHEACGLVQLHDSGYVARIVDGRRGFKVVVGGGLGTVPHQAKVLSEFTPEEELLPQTQAIARVFARLGEKKNRNRARIKFLVANLGIDEFRRLVEEERRTLPHDPRWTAYLADIPRTSGDPALDRTSNDRPRPLDGPAHEGLADFQRTNVLEQRQDGHLVVTINLPLGDLSAGQARTLADLAGRYVGDNMRTTVEQNVVLRSVSKADLPRLYEELAAAGLAAPGASTLVDVTACPGTDTCKLGIASSRGLGGTLRRRLVARSAELDEAVKGLHIKVSGCFNSCGQHHVADIGFYGVSRKSDDRTVPHFQVVLGGQWNENAGAYGMAVGTVPSKVAPQVVDALTERFVQERDRGETFRDWVNRVGKRDIRTFLEPLMKIPTYSENPDYYSDWADPREFTIRDLGVGECAGEVVSLFGIEVVRAESQAFDAQVALDEGEYALADELAYRAMLTAARSLVRTRFIDVTEDADDIVRRWQALFFDTELFFDRYAKGKFGQYLLARHSRGRVEIDRDLAASLVEEAQLFIEAAHACETRLVALESAGQEAGTPAEAPGVADRTSAPHRR
ncbi:MAG: nitrite/sulfite reductase [Gaiellales bacterium]